MYYYYSTAWLFGSIASAYYYYNLIELQMGFYPVAVVLQ
jgi:hypothetical protein